MVWCLWDLLGAGFDDQMVPPQMTPPKPGEAMTAEQLWEKFVSESGDYANTQYPLFKEIIAQAQAEAFSDALEKAAKVAEEKIDDYHYDGSTIADRIRSLRAGEGK